MPSYEPAKKNTAFITYVTLVSQANGKLFQVNPTLAAGDVKVSIDGGALANLATLPAVTPAASVMVKVSLSAAEMNGDNISVVFSDAAGSEWNDLFLNIQTVTRQMDDLAFPQTSGRGELVNTDGSVAPDWANIKSPTTTVNLSGTTVGVLTSVAASAIGATSVSTAGQNAAADGLLDRIMSAGVDSGGDNTTARTVRQALRVLRNDVSIAAGVMTVTKEDDVTPSFTAAITTTAGNPISEVNPT